MMRETDKIDCSAASSLQEMQLLSPITDVQDAQHTARIHLTLALDSLGLSYLILESDPQSQQTIQHLLLH